MFELLQGVNLDHAILIYVTFASNTLPVATPQFWHSTLPGQVAYYALSESIFETPNLRKQTNLSEFQI